MAFAVSRCRVFLLLVSSGLASDPLAVGDARRAPLRDALQPLGRGAARLDRPVDGWIPVLPAAGVDRISPGGNRPDAGAGAVVPVLPAHGASHSSRSAGIGAQHAAAPS